jgi:dienelactone hydrolase
MGLPYRRFDKNCNGQSHPSREGAHQEGTCGRISSEAWRVACPIDSLELELDEVREQCQPPDAWQAGGTAKWEPIRIRTGSASKRMDLAGLLGYPEQPRQAALQAVVLVHGFAAEKTENGLFTEIGAELLRSGYIVLMYDWRGLRDSEGDFSRTTLRTHTSDLRCVVDWLGRTCGLASTQLCSVGFSLGAALIAQAITNGLRLGASSYWSPAVRPNLSMWPRYSTPEMQSELRARGFILKAETNVRLGSQILNSLRSTDLGSTAFVLGPPLLVCHGTNDERIPIEHSRQLFSASSRRDSLSFAEFDGASHSFRPAPEMRPNLFRLFMRWLSSDGLKGGRHRLRIPQGAQSRHAPAWSDHSATS